jgi:hypothetical protein
MAAERQSKSSKDAGFRSLLERFCEKEMLVEVSEGADLSLFHHLLATSGRHSFLGDCLKSKLVSLSDTEGSTKEYLQLPAHQKWRLGETVLDTNKLMVPRHFSDYRTAILGCLNSCHSAKTMGNVYRSESPGIGKSAMLVYIIYQLLHPEDLSDVPWIVYQPIPGWSNWDPILRPRSNLIGDLMFSRWWMAYGI